MIKPPVNLTNEVEEMYNLIAFLSQGTPQAPARSASLHKLSEAENGKYGGS